jgi:metal-sulfur cluster biosynthetic enzyme
MVALLCGTYRCGKSMIPRSDVSAELIWEPAWTEARMSPQAKRQLGWE